MTLNDSTYKVAVKNQCSVYGIVATTLRLSIAIILITSGMMKGVNLQSVAQTVRTYFSLFGFTPDAVTVSTVGFATCALEIWLGMLAINKTIHRLIYPVYILVFIGFSFMTYVNLTSPFGNHESCGCFGEVIHLDATATFVKNLILLCMAIMAGISYGYDISGYQGNRRNPLSSFRKHFLICAAASLLPVTLSAILMNRINTSAYVCLYIGISLSSILIVAIHIVWASKSPNMCITD